MMKRNKFILGFLIMVILISPVNSEEVTGKTFARMDTLSFLNVLDKGLCESLGTPYLTEKPTHFYSIQHPPELSPCHDQMYPYPEILEGSQMVITSSLSFYPELKLRVRDHVLKENEKVCVGDTIRVDLSHIKGDWFKDGGPVDCPRIIWVSPEKMESIITESLSYHSNRLGYPLTDQYSTDPFVKSEIIPKTVGLRHCTPEIYAHVVCTKNLRGEIRDEIKVEKEGPIKVNVGYEPKCIFYNPKGEVTSWEWGHPPKGGLRWHYRVFLTPQGWKHQPGNLEPDLQYKSSPSNWLGYISPVTKISLSSTLHGVEVKEKPQLEITDFERSKVEEHYVIRLLVKNEGNGKAKIDEVTLNLPDYEILYQPKYLEPGEEKEILIKTKEPILGDLKVTLKYKAEDIGCLTTKKFEETFELEGKHVLSPLTSAQVYHMNVRGDCENEYHACNAPDKEGNFYAGYKCFNRNPYFVPTQERFNVKFDLSSLPQGKNIEKIWLYVHVSEVNEPQEIEIFSVSDAWAPKICEPGGDICEQPYCKQCAPSFDLKGNLVGRQEISNEGWHNIELSGVIEGKKEISFQVRGGKEKKIWPELGKDSCSQHEEWNHYDVVFSGADGDNKPYLQVIYEKLQSNFSASIK